MSPRPRVPRGRRAERLGALVLALMACGLVAGPAAAQGSPDRDVAVAQDQTFAYVGATFNQVLAFDPRAQSFTVDFYLWMHWRGEEDLTSTVELVNVWGSEHIMAPARPRAQVLANGERYQSWHVQADFITPLDFADYPRDTQTLVVKVEDSAHDARSLVFLPDQVSAGPDFAAIPAGYVLARPPSDAVVTEHVYPTTFGLAGPGASTYSQVQFDFDVRRPIRSYLDKSFLPVGIVVLIALMAYLLGPTRVDSRVALAVTAMISAVLLHMDAAAAIPPTPRFLRVDWIFLTAYLVILIALVESILSVHLHDRGRQASARRMDLGAALLSAVLFSTGVVLALA